MARLCCQRLQSVAKLFRFVELCIAVVFLSWLSSRLPFAVRVSGEYCRRFSAFIVSPTSIFLLGNAIVVTLLAKSGLFSAGDSSPVNNAVSDLYEEFRSEIDGEIKPETEGDEIVYQDKEIICEENTKVASPNAVVAAAGDDQKQASEVKSSYQRSKSEKLKSVSEKKMKSNEKLRRSETDICRKDFTGRDDAAAELPEDDDEFRRTIEAFIAKQVRFHREERLAVVLHGQA